MGEFSHNKITRFIEHNYIVDTSARSRRLLYAVLTFSSIINCINFLLRLNDGTINWIDCIFLIITIALIIAIILIINSVNRVAEEKQFITNNLFCTLFSIIEGETFILYFVYLMLGRKMLILSIIYEIVITILTYYIEILKHNKWIENGYEQYSEKVAKNDLLHTKIWHRNSPYPIMCAAILFVCRRMPPSLLFLIGLSLAIVFLIDVFKAYLQLKYAEQYDLTEYLPQAPNDTLKPY